MSLLSITSQPLHAGVLAAELEREVQGRGEGCGAVCTFLGIVRATHKGRRVRYLEYEAFEPLALKTFDRIAREIAADWPEARVAIHHRVGRLAVGEASVIIAAASSHRAESFQVCRYAIERIKQIAPIWKHEFFAEGDAWVEGATADIEDETARRRARDIAACV
ncbi:MAG TPA: molybdenum cofactor biosynthesis protein MoaE [Vicinamibacterales bacterium]|nr:molybdenum cofactor biosynthesis protein MoaE [Vicinamibacterales bacterium]